MYQGIMMFEGDSCEYVLEPASLNVSHSHGNLYRVHTLKHVVYRRYSEDLISGQAECYVSAVAVRKFLLVLSYGPLPHLEWLRIKSAVTGIARNYFQGREVRPYGPPTFTNTFFLFFFFVFIYPFTDYSP